MLPDSSQRYRLPAHVPDRFAPSTFPMTSRQIPGCLSFLIFSAALAAAATSKPNILFIVSDDLNHWVGTLHRNPQTQTPNIDRLAKRGVNFTHAYCASSVCNASRSAFMSGRRTATIGVYGNAYMPWSNYINEAECINGYLRSNGYETLGVGKLYHKGGPGAHTEGTHWDEYVVGFGRQLGDDDDGDEGGGRRGRNRRPTSGKAALETDVLPGNKRIGEFEIGQPSIPDSETEDYKIAEWGAAQLARRHDRPFFLSVGFHKPHLPWIVPKKYFDLFPLETIQLPPHIADDTKDLPPAAMRFAHNSRWELVMKQGGENAWKQVVQAYLASIAYMDAQLGIVIDALDKGPNSGNTVVVFLGDHGWHVGEKERFGKSTVWEEAARAPLIWVAPQVAPAGVNCERTVDFLSFFPTLCDLAGLPKPAYLEGVSIQPLLEDPSREWNHPALTTYGYKNHAIRTENWRYIRYANGDEELYDEIADPYEWNNLAGDPKHASVKTSLAGWLPKTDKPPMNGQPVLERRAERRKQRSETPR